MSELINNFLEREEGRVLHAYQDQVGKWTIGVGSTMYQDGSPVKKGDVITNDEADALRDWGVNNREKVIKGLLGKIQLNENQMAALISFTYNEGIGAFERSTLLKVIKKNPLDPYIRNCFAMWNKITIKGKKVVSEDLVGRRKREADLYFTPVTDN